MSRKHLFLAQLGFTLSVSLYAASDLINPGLSRSAISQTAMGQQIQQQLHQPTSLESLFARLDVGKWVCFSIPNPNQSTAFHLGGIPDRENSEFVLYVDAKNSFQLNVCTVGAFEALHNQAFEIGIWIPKIRGGSRKITPVCDGEMKTV